MVDSPEFEFDEQPHGWTHPQCINCWDKERPPVTMQEDYRQVEVCCWCGEETSRGIYVRHDPKRLFSHNRGYAE